MEKVYKEKFMYKLFCDSNCELNYKTVAELGLTVIKMPYYIDNEEYFYDMGEKHDFKGFFDKNNVEIPFPQVVVHNSNK